jgi:Protein of unknown function (DUF1593)
MPKTRVCISHDGWLGSTDKHHVQSLILALMFQDRIDIQRIAATSSRWGDTQRTSNTHKILDAYAKDWAKLDAETDGFKTASELKAISCQGAAKVAPSAGYSAASFSSKAIINKAKEAAAAGEKFRVLTWGGEPLGAVHDEAEETEPCYGSGLHILFAPRCSWSLRHARRAFRTEKIELPQMRRRNEPPAVTQVYRPRRVAQSDDVEPVAF